MKVKIVYRCVKRKADFTRTVEVDPENAKKILLSKWELNSKGRLRLKYAGHIRCSEGVSASIPGYLFGEQYAHRQRISGSSEWDFTREAFSI